MGEGYTVFYEYKESYNPESLIFMPNKIANTYDPPDFLTERLTKWLVVKCPKSKNNRLIVYVIYQM